MLIHFFNWQNIKQLTSAYLSCFNNYFFSFYYCFPLLFLEVGISYVFTIYSEIKNTYWFVFFSVAVSVSHIPRNISQIQPSIIYRPSDVLKINVYATMWWFLYHINISLTHRWHIVVLVISKNRYLGFTRTEHKFI